MRRTAWFLSFLGIFALGYDPASTALGAERRTVRDAMWMWAADAGVLDGRFGLPAKSTLTPVDGTKWMGLSNVIMIRCGGKPTPPFEEYARPFRCLKRVMWSVTGEGGATSQSERDHVFALAAKMPNMTGVFMDDFFHFTASQTTTGETRAAISLKDLQQLRKRLTVRGRKLDLGVTLYTHQLDHRILPHLNYCDVVSLWTWTGAELANLEKNLDKFQAIAPGKRTLLGLYMWDFGPSKPMPLELMKKQCRLALKWLREGRIEGMIFLVTNLCDLNLEAVNWSRSWIAEVGEQPLERAP